MRGLLTLFLFLAAPAAAFPVERCINLSAALEAEVEGSWGYIIEEHHLAAIADAGFDTIRLPVRFSAHWTGTDISPSFLARVDAVIDWAQAAGLTVILDLHHFWPLSEDPKTHIPTLISIWDALGRHYVDAGPDLIFELFNEPEGAFTTQIATEVFSEIIARLRPTHPDRWIITGGGNWNALDEMLRLPEPGAHQAHTFHYYTPWDFTHQNAAYLPAPPPARGWGTAEDIAAMEQAFDRATAAAGPVFLGEFGVYEAAPAHDRLAWIQAVRRAAEARGIPWCYWGFSQGSGEGFTAYDTATGQWDIAVLEALLGTNAGSSPLPVLPKD